MPLPNAKVEAANYPFATIDPECRGCAGAGRRLAKLSALEKSEKIVPTTIEFVDIAGLVKGCQQRAKAWEISSLSTYPRSGRDFGSCQVF